MFHGYGRPAPNVPPFSTRVMYVIFVKEGTEGGGYLLKLKRILEQFLM